MAVFAIGARLLWLAGRTRRRPELWIGVAFLGCGLGYLLMLGARAPALATQTHLLHAAGRAAFALGCSSIGIATWRIFRPVGLAPLVWVCALLLGIGASIVSELLFESSPVRSTQPLFWVGFASSALPFGWSAFECFRYRATLRRQSRLGLVDPAAARPMLLWGVASLAIFAIFPLAAWNIVRTGDAFTLGQRLLTVACTLVAAGCIWAAFFPPSKRLARTSRDARSG